AADDLQAVDHRHPLPLPDGLGEVGWQGSLAVRADEMDRRSLTGHEDTSGAALAIDADAADLVERGIQGPRNEAIATREDGLAVGALQRMAEGRCVVGGAIAFAPNSRTSDIYNPFPNNRLLAALRARGQCFPQPTQRPLTGAAVSDHTELAQLDNHGRLAQFV